MPHWLDAGLLGSSRLVDRLFGIPFLPLRTSTFLNLIDTVDPSACVPGQTVTKALPLGLQPIDLDPGWAVARLAEHVVRSPVELLHYPWWRDVSEEPARKARNQLWCHSVALAFAVHKAGRRLPRATRAKLAHAALIQRLELWAIADGHPHQLAEYLACSNSTEAREWEHNHLGRSGLRLASQLARQWGIDPRLIRALRDPDAHQQGQDRSRPAWRETWNQALELVAATPWAIPGSLETVGSPIKHDVRWLTATVQAACSGGLVGYCVDPALEPLVRDLARSRLELVLRDEQRPPEAVVVPPRSEPAPTPREPNAISPDDLEALAEFAGGAAHEINNPLAVVVGRAQLLLAKSSDPDVRRSLLTILQQARRAHQILRDLIYVARPPEPRLKLCSPGAVLRASAAEYASEATERGITLEIPTPIRDLSLMLDPEGLHHLAEILLRNALESTPTGGHIRIRGETDSRGARWWIESPQATLDDEAAQHLFHPFYCGRQAGRGLGLGLPRAARWLNRIGGHVRILRPASGGTTVEVYMPAPPTLAAHDRELENGRSA